MSAARAEQSPQDCAEIAVGEERLLCYDGIFKDKKEAEKPTPTNTKWQLSTSKSEMDDSATQTLALTSDDSFAGKFGGMQRATMILRCSEHVTSLYFVMGDMFLAEIQGYGQITYRVDDKKAAQRSFNVSTDNQALGLWSGGAAIPFAKQLFGGKKLVIRVTPYNESAITTTFDISDIENAAKPVREECKW
ncbi:type VI secretion system-associated protein TagO [Rhizobium bangladeshense]|uniref:type VI secretion system-associated protein TagO n=1 Tax=Rhizobium bangladeshense TaxID=1138189 RepID=UPI001C831679|nr:type VI secretion system-associated protein TagO [Rhizobium bangladeshense]MBX4899496.1 hypothetical protein [Rhizobium bangladeshense]MBY3617709.1 hypothetical protein [Rhizobium bangladeshense]